MRDASIWRTNCETVAIVMLSFMSQQVQVRMWGLIMMSKHNLSSADVCTNITSISSLIIFLTDWTLKRWLYRDCNNRVEPMDQGHSGLSVTEPLFLRKYKILLGRRQCCVTISRESGSARGCRYFPPTSKLQPERREIKLDIRKLRFFLFFFTLVVICFLTTRCC